MAVFRRLGCHALAALGLVCLAGTAHAQSVEELLRRIDALQRRVEELEARGAPAPARRAAAPSPSRGSPPVPSRGAAPAPAPVVLAAPPPSPEERRRITRAEVDEALRGDMPNSVRIPGTETSVRLYGFIKANLYGDLDVRNRSDAPSVQGIPLVGSAAARQGGDLTFSARRSRIGFETHTPTEWGPLVTKLEFDFAGDQPSPSGLATSSGYMARLRQAYAEVGGEEFRVLFGQANSLWNEGLIETLTDATFINASAVRQAQIRVTGRLAPGLTGQLSLEAPYTDYTSTDGIFYPDSTLDGGASPATSQLPDLIGRLNWRGTYGEASLRGLVRQLRIDASGTAALPAGSSSTIGWGVAANGSFNMSRLWDGFGADQLIGMAYYGEGIGRYFDATTAGQAAYSRLGLPGVGETSLSAVPSWGFVAGYKRYWTPMLRSTAAYGYARLDNPDFVSQFAAGGSGATAANREMQMAVANLIWSPFARESDGRIDLGWLDVGVEYIYFRRDLEGGAAAGGAEGGRGIEQRIQASAIARF